MTERARIRRIQVTNLFGIFNHEIRLNLDERITILHGPNGFGKTIILQMLDGDRQPAVKTYSEEIVEAIGSLLAIYAS